MFQNLPTENLKNCHSEESWVKLFQDQIRKKKWRRPINVYILNKELYIDIKVSFWSQFPPNAIIKQKAYPGLLETTFHYHCPEYPETFIVKCFL